VALMHVSYWLTLALALPAAGFLVRLFLINTIAVTALFSSPRDQRLGRRVCGVVTLTPMIMERTHAPSRTPAISTVAAGRHRDADVESIGARLAQAAPLRLYRHPIVMFGLGRPIFSCCSIARRSASWARAGSPGCRRCRPTSGRGRRRCADVLIGPGRSC